MRDQWLQIKAIFHEALSRLPEAQEAFLKQACGENSSLQEEIKALLGAYHPAKDFFSRVAHELGQPPEPETLQASFRGRKLGAYRLIDELGHGGMGAVYLAERADGQFEKKVAVKIVPHGLWSEELFHRFCNERQILAHLEHPNIARLLDGGVTDEGLPYLVMEYVKGFSIAHYCDEHRLNISARLRLFRKVCDAVEHAHLQEIVHRDLKPANILVTPEGTPKLLDFGIAKIMSANHEALSRGLTRTGFLPMTPEYASPEQVRGEEITRASDLYALGVLLYLLLTGHAPYRLHNCSPQETARIICEHEPELLSRVIFKVEEPANAENMKLTPEVVSQSREGTPNKLRRRLQGDLDNILIKALRKEPERRYASVEEFSQDLRRHLEGLPVKARGKSLWYRGGKAVHEQKYLILLVSVIAILFAASILFKPRILSWLQEMNTAGKNTPEVSCLLDPPVASYENGKSHTMTLTMRIKGLPMAGIPVRFEVQAGPNRGLNNSVTTNVQGQASMTYRGRGGLLGTDTIRVAAVYDDSIYAQTAYTSWYLEGTLFGPLGAPVGKLKKGAPLYGGISCEGYRFSESVIAAHGQVTLARIAENQLAVKIELRHGDPNFMYEVEIFEAGSDCVSSDLGATGVFLRADQAGNGLAEVVLQLPYAPPQQHVLGDGKGSEALIVVLNWIDSDKGGDRFSTDAMALPKTLQ